METAAGGSLKNPIGRTDPTVRQYRGGMWTGRPNEPIQRMAARLTVMNAPADDAVVVPLGGPTRTALGCFGLTTLFLAAIALAALSYAIFGVPGPPNGPSSLHVVAAVLGGLFLLIVIGLAVTALRAVRGEQGLVFDADAVWCRPDRVTVPIPWADIDAVRVVPPEIIKGIRTSTPRTPSVQLVTDVRRYPELASCVTSGESLRFTFRLATKDDERTVADAVARFAPSRWVD